MKVSDYIISFLERRGVKDVFLLSGGGMMHILDSLAKNGAINKYYSLNEQAAAFCADAYAQTSGRLGVCLVTTGPGGTNAVTGFASAHIDSTPLLVISGQVRTDAMVGGRKIRQYGAQEIGIVKIVESVSKYAVTVMDPADIRFCLEKAVFLALDGRPGAVWVDVPLDVQGARVEPDSLKPFDPAAETGEPAAALSKDDLDAVFSLLGEARRPVLIAGNGVWQDGSCGALLDFARRANIPVLSSRRIKRLFTDGAGVRFYGCPGALAPRYANYILQNSDAMLSIGCGLGYAMTSYNERNFAPRAKKIINNIDVYEISKLDMEIERGIVCGAGGLLNGLLGDPRTNGLPGWDKWLEYCDGLKHKYPPEKEPPERDGAVSGYALCGAVKKHSSSFDVIVPSSTSYIGAYFYVSYIPKDGQSMIFTMGLGAMGSGLPGAIGACVASGKKRTILIEGDGSLQHNIQELALIKTYGLPLKIFIESNGGYLQIKNMQERHFEGRLAGCTPESGVGFPPLRDIARAYGLRYERVENNAELDEKTACVLNGDDPVLCEIIGSDTPCLFPVVQSRVLENGKMATASMEDMYPFLSQDEHARNMSISI